MSQEGFLFSNQIEKYTIFVTQQYIILLRAKTKQN